METPLIWRMCASKRKYLTRKEARQAARRERRRLGGGLHSYRCFFCGYCHVGHSS